MANLSPPVPRGAEGRDRGQLLLVAAFILAVAFVVLALVVNSAIFTENLATRDDVPGSADALEHRAEVSDGVGDLVAAINEDNDRAPEDVTDSVDGFAARNGISQSSGGRVVTVEYLDHDTGAKIAQDEVGAFESKGGDRNWQLATDSEIRNVVLSITDPPDSPFSLVASDGDDWEMAVAEDAGNLSVTVTNPDDETATCTHTEQAVTIDVTGGTVGGTPCHALTRRSDGEQMHFAVGLGDSYDLEIENGDEVEGTYSMIVDGNPDGSNLETDGPDPYFTDALYSVDLRYEFHTAAVSYGTDVRVAPGEAPP